MHTKNSIIPNVQPDMAASQYLNGQYSLLTEKALGLGCERAIIIQTDTIATARWVQLKCKYGCDEYGKKLTCPPHAPTCEEMRDILKEYSHALFLHGHLSWQMRYIVSEMEKLAFSLGFYKAFGLGAGPCKLCDNCDTTAPCTRADEARPSMEACGIDVYQTARNHDMRIETLKDKNGEVNIYGLVLVE